MEVHLSNATALESNVNETNTSMPLTASPGSTLLLVALFMLLFQLPSVQSSFTLNMLKKQPFSF